MLLIFLHFLTGLKVFETNERELVMEPAFKWAGNPNIIVTLTISSVQVTVQVSEARRNFL